MKHIVPIEMNFETGLCEESFNAKLLYEIGRIKALPNPYVGNKRKILFNIVDFLESEKIKYDCVLDLFSGSSSVGLLMKLVGKRVLSNDILLSSYIYARAFIENNTVTISEDKKNMLLYEKNSSVNDFATYRYRNRFTKNECGFLENFRANINNLSNQHERALAFAAIQLYVTDKCFVGGRLNSGQILAKLDHRLQHQRNQGYAMSFKDMRWFDFNCPENSHTNKAFCFDAIDVLKKSIIKDVDLVYIDPPYGGQQSDYYHMYEFFEVFIEEGYPTEDTVGTKKFCSSKDYESNFIELIKATSKIPTIMISYNDSSWADLDKIKDIVRQFKNNISVREISYDYKYRDQMNKKGIEYLIIAS